jgi:hypothetical protein
MANFTSITYEAYISGSWVDLTPDVLAEPAPTFSRGISGNQIEDRVADVGRLRFSLNNSADNAAGLLGYYSPGHTNALTGWTTSLPVRLRFAYDSWNVIKWRGVIEPDGIQVQPFVNNERRVNVTCIDYMGIASRHKINLLTLQTNKYLWQGVETVLGNMPIQPLATNFADESALSTMPVIFDVIGTDTTAIAEFQKLAASQRMSVVVRADGDGPGETLTTIYTPSSYISTVPVVTAESDILLLETGDNLLLETGDNLLLDMRQTATVDDSDLMEGTEIVYGKNIMNYLTVVTYPREQSGTATEVLWTLEQAELVTAGNSITIRGTYNDPNGGARINGTDFVTPVANTDYKANAAENGTGADLTASLSVTATFGAADVELILANTGGTDLYVGGGTAGAFFQVQGRSILVYDPVREVFRDTTSIATHGVHPYTVDLKYQKQATETISSKAGFGQGLINLYKNPDYSIEKAALIANRDTANMALFLFTEPGNEIRFTESMNGLSAKRAIAQGYDATILPGGIVSWSINTKRLGV